MTPLKFIYNVTYAGHDQPAAIPHFIQAQWWSWSEVMAASPITRNAFFNDLTRGVAKPQTRRIPVIDPETLQNPVQFISDMLAMFPRRRISKALLINQFPGQTDLISMQDSLAAMKSVIAGKPTDAGRGIRSLAWLHRPFVTACNVVCHNCSVHTPSQFDWFLDWMQTGAAYLGLMYPGVERCAWLSGCYVIGEFRGQQFSEEECGRILDTVEGAGFNSVALYGGVNDNSNFTAALVRRLGKAA